MFVHFTIIPGSESCLWCLIISFNVCRTDLRIAHFKHSGHLPQFQRSGRLRRSAFLAGGFHMEIVQFRNGQTGVYAVLLGVRAARSGGGACEHGAHHSGGVSAFQNQASVSRPAVLRVVFFITMLFSGGLIPYYMTISKVGLVDSFWALILPGAVPVYNVIILLNFFRNLPGEIEEAARVDGASYLRVLFQIIVPLSLPAIATLTLFCTVNHWNSWFEGLLLMNDPTHYPLQSYLQTVIVNRDMSLMSTTDILTLSEVSDRTSKAAQTFVAAVPMLVIYPFCKIFYRRHHAGRRKGVIHHEKIVFIGAGSIIFVKI